MCVELGEARMPRQQAVCARLPGEDDAQVGFRGLKSQSLVQHAGNLLGERFALLLE